MAHVSPSMQRRKSAISLSPVDFVGGDQQDYRNRLAAVSGMHKTLDDEPRLAKVKEKSWSANHRVP
jgi:hypothetical protein